MRFSIDYDIKNKNDMNGTKSNVLTWLKHIIDIIPNAWACNYICWLEKHSESTKQSPEMILALLSLLLPPIYNTKKYSKETDCFAEEHISYGWIEDDKVCIYFSKSYESLFFRIFLSEFSKIVKCEIHNKEGVYYFE